MAMSKCKKWMLLLLMTVMVMLPTQAMAIDPIDLSRPVSLTVNYNWDGARFDLYRVAESDRFAVFTLSGDFADFKRDINGCENSEDWNTLTQSAAAYVDACKLQPLRVATIHNKSCKFSPLDAGLYLVIGHDVTINGTTYVCDPFMICLPDRDAHDVWIYDAAAQPKSGEPIPPVTPPPPNLPQTGQLWWPVPILLGTGLFSLLIGSIRRRGADDE